MNGERPRIPIGRVEDLERQKETLPGTIVKNETIWVNDEINEFDLEKGKPARLGTFLNPRDDDPDSVPLEVRYGHHRSGIITRRIFHDDKQWYRDVRLKGIGFMTMDKENYSTKSIVKPIYRMRAGYLGGILKYKSAKWSAEWDEGFYEAGIRTDRVMAIIRLLEYIDENGDKQPIDELKKKFIVHRDFDPVVEVDAFGTITRINEVIKDKDEAQLLLDDARILVAEELGIKPDQFSFHDYLLWFAQNLGRNISLMHKNGWIHQNLTMENSHHINITLDCRIVDKDTVYDVYEKPLEKPVIEKAFIKDIDQADEASAILYNDVKEYSGQGQQLADEQVYRAAFEEAYDKVTDEQ